MPQDAQAGPGPRILGHVLGRVSSFERREK
jgi:hypothetical protein